jgi:hypothetical protein
MKTSAKRPAALALVLALALALVLLLALLPGSVLAADPLWITEDLGDGSVSITGYRGTAINLDIPETIDGGTVVMIGAEAFRENDFLVNVTIPDTVTYIADGAFMNCMGLKSVTIPDSVTAIGRSVFCYCTKLESIRIPGSVEFIGYSTFQGCEKLASVELNEGLVQVEGGAFDGCTALESICIPSTLTNTGGPFTRCTALRNVTFAPGTESVTANLLSGCPGIIEMEIPDSVTFIGESAFQNCENLESVTIPGSVTYIGSCAFSRCPLLKTVTVPEGVTAMGSEVFRYCSSLESVRLPESLTYIGFIAFLDCPSLTDVYYGSGSESWEAVDKGDNFTLLPDVTVHFTAPGPIPGGSVTAAPGKITVKWQPALRATAYVLQRRTVGGSWTTLKSVLRDNSYVDAAVVPGTDYEYRVRGRNGTVCGTFRVFGPITARPALPGAISSVTATAAPGKTTVSWTASERATAYIIQRRVKDSDAWTTLKSNVTATSYEDTTGVAGTVYQYRVRGRNGTDYGPFKVSSVVRAQAGAALPGAISTVTATAAPGKITVTWSASNGATAYIIQRRVKGSDTWTTLKSNVTGTSYVDTTGVAGTVYQYRVRGRDGTNYGPFKASSVVRALPA